MSAGEGVCSGPFSDARDCPVHGKDIREPISIVNDLRARLEKAESENKRLREALVDCAEEAVTDSNQSRAEAWLRERGFSGIVVGRHVTSLTALLDEHRGCDCGPSGHRYSDCPAFVAGVASAEARVRELEQVVDTELHLRRQTVGEREALAFKVRELEAEMERLREALRAAHDAMAGAYAMLDPETKASQAIVRILVDCDDQEGPCPAFTALSGSPAATRKEPA